MRIAGHSGVTVSQRYVHPTPEGLERAFERLENLNAENLEQARAEAQAEVAGGSRVATISATVKKRQLARSKQVVVVKVRALSSAG